MLELNKQMNDEKLKIVCGGENGDEQKDTNSAQSWYEVGQYVQLYKSFIHVGASRQQIIAKRLMDGHWVYKFRIAYKKGSVQNPETYYIEEWHSADAIVR